MSRGIFRYEFEQTIDPDEIEASLLLALIGTESLHGETATRLSASHFFDAQKRECVIDADNDVGRAFNSLFAGFLRREFGPESFQIRRVESADLAAAGTAA